MSQRVSGYTQRGRLAGVSRALFQSIYRGCFSVFENALKVERAAQELDTDQMFSRSLTTRKTLALVSSPITSIIRFFSKSLTCSLDSYKPLDYGH